MMLSRLKRLALRLVVIVVVGLAIMFAPTPAKWPSWTPLVQGGIAAMVVVFSIGKLLYDTLFYDHYGP